MTLQYDDDNSEKDKVSDHGNQDVLQDTRRSTTQFLEEMMHEDVYLEEDADDPSLSFSDGELYEPFYFFSDNLSK